MDNAVTLPAWESAPHPDIPLDSIPIKQYDTPEQPKQDRGHRLFEGLMDGTTDCIICHEEIEAESQMWSCKSCYHIYHFACIKRWAENKGSSTWPCPTCKTIQKKSPVTMTPSCWCGRQSRKDISYRGNTCGATCFKEVKCSDNPGRPCRSNCSKPCHPGLCEPAACNDWCPSMRHVPIGRTPKTANMNPVQYYRELNRLERQDTTQQEHPSSRYRDRGRDNPRRTATEPLAREAERYLKRGFFSLTAVSFILVPIIIWLISRIPSWARPLEHTHFTEHTRKVDRRAVLMVIAVTPSFFCFLLAVCGYYILKGLGILFRRHRTDDLLQFVIKLFVVAALVVYNYSLMGLGIGGIGISWKKQMKNSCQGFDTRVNLDIYIKGDGNPHFPSHKLSLYTPDLPNPPPHQLGIDDFEFTSPIDSSKSPSEPYHTYHRMTGTLSPSQHLAIDFDLPNHLWRIMNLTYTDPSLNPTTSFPGTARTLFKSGTWSPTNETNPHAFIPELSLQIPNLYYYTRHCAYQPFMKVYTTTNLNATQITEQGNRTWSPLNEKEVVMRTAAFGYLPEKLEVCARRNEYEVNGTKMHGLREDVVVPLGLLAALRLQMRADGKFERGCEYVGA